MNYDRDKYDAITNGQGTFDAVANDLIVRSHVVLNWTDGRGTLLNVLFSFDPTRVGAPGGMVDDGPGKLWVGIAGHGMFGFRLNGYVAPGYAQEKLGVRGSTAVRIAELVTGVRDAMGDGRLEGDMPSTLRRLAELRHWASGIAVDPHHLPCPGSGRSCLGDQ